MVDRAATGQDLDEQRPDEQAIGGGLRGPRPQTHGQGTYPEDAQGGRDDIESSAQK